MNNLEYFFVRFIARNCIKLSHFHHTRHTNVIRGINQPGESENGG